MTEDANPGKYDILVSVLYTNHPTVEAFRTFSITISDPCATDTLALDANNNFLNNRDVTTLPYQLEL